MVPLAPWFVQRVIGIATARPRGKGKLLCVRERTDVRCNIVSWG